jgi:hypothetical protein
MGILEPVAIDAIKETLTNFENLTGLKCNVEKSQLMIIGTDNIPDFVTQSGFDLTNSIRMLGFDITKNFNDLPDNFNKSIEKMQGIIRFWERF